MNSVSCAAAGACVAGGDYKDGSGDYQAFVVNYTSPCVVPQVVGKTLSAAKRSLKAAHCSVGKTTRVYSKLKKGRVVAEKPEGRQAPEERGQGRAHSEQGREEVGPTVDLKITVSRQYAEVLQVYRVVA